MDVIAVFLLQGVEGGQKALCSMETDAVTDKLTCYLLFKKFTREVCYAPFTSFILFITTLL